MYGVNEERVKLWIQALRSGEYEQARGYMEVLPGAEDDNGEVSDRVRHCCLGVATRVALANGWSLVPRWEDDELDWGQTAMDERVGAWYGFPFGEKSDPPLVRATETQGEIMCTTANDELDWNFEQIANALEALYISPENIEQEA